MVDPGIADASQKSNGFRSQPCVDEQPMLQVHTSLHNTRCACRTASRAGALNPAAAAAAAA